MNVNKDKSSILLLKNIKAVVFDNDGVLTDNTEIIGLSDGTVLKRRSHYDGQGISFLRAVGIRVAILTGDSGKGAEAITQLVAKWNNLPSVKTGTWEKVHLVTGVMGKDKAKELISWLADSKITSDECAAMGDDYVDLPMLNVVAYKAAPITAEKNIIKIANFVSERRAGEGAARDFINYILEIKGIDSSTLATS